MQIQASEKKVGGNSGPKQIGYWKGTLKYVNPTASELKEIYGMEEEPEEVKYSGTDKNEKDWALLRFVFIEELQNIPIEYRVFISKDIAEFEKDGITKSWYINQWGLSQLVADKKDLFRSFTHMQTWNKKEKKMEDVLGEDQQPIELSWRKAYKGETSIYSMLRKLVTQDWWQANQETNLFIKIDQLMRGKLTDITSIIGSEYVQSVVGCIEIQAKDGENGINYYQNCVDQAWMQGWKCKEANLITSSNSWNKYDDKAAGKGKGKELYEFYQAVKRNKHITELVYIHEFDPSKHLAAGNQTIAHTESSNVTDTDY